MKDTVTITIGDPNLPEPVIVTLPRRYIKQRRLDVVVAYMARAMDEYLLRSGWDTQPETRRPVSS